MKTTLSQYICGMLRSSCFMLPPVAGSSELSLSLNPWLDAHLYASHLLCLGTHPIFLPTLYLFHSG